MLDLIPENAAVSASTFFTTPLSQRDVLYDVKYAAKENILSTQYIALQPSCDTSFIQYADDNGENGYRNFANFLEENGYLLWQSLPNHVEIYKKTE